MKKRKTAIEKALDELSHSHHAALMETMRKLGYPLEDEKDEPYYWTEEQKQLFDALTQYKDALDRITKEKYSNRK